MDAERLLVKEDGEKEGMGKEERVQRSEGEGSRDVRGGVCWINWIQTYSVFILHP